MTTVPQLEPHAAAVETLLRTISTTERPLGVYDGVGPPRPHEATPYVVLYAYPSTYGGPAGDHQADVDFRILVRSVGLTAAQARAAGDRVRMAMLGDGPTPPPGRAMRGPVSVEPLRGAVRDDEARTTNPLWISDEIYVIPTTPA